MSGCVFCARIDRDEIDYDHGPVVEFEPLNPVTPGHALFVPRIHLSEATTVPWLTGKVFEVAAEHGARQGRSFNLITSAGSSATQTVFHLHVHYVPRVPGDGLMLPWSSQHALGASDA